MDFIVPCGQKPSPRAFAASQKKLISTTQGDHDAWTIAVKTISFGIDIILRPFFNNYFLAESPINRFRTIPTLFTAEKDRRPVCCNLYFQQRLFTDVEE